MVVLQSINDKHTSYMLLYYKWLCIFQQSFLSSKILIKILTKTSYFEDKLKNFVLDFLDNKNARGES